MPAQLVDKRQSTKRIHSYGSRASDPKEVLAPEQLASGGNCLVQAMMPISSAGKGMVSDSATRPNTLPLQANCTLAHRLGGRRERSESTGG